MAPKFGTSGLRGLAIELTPDLVRAYVHAFINACPMGAGLFVARDLRESSPAISSIVVEAARDVGIDVTDCGAVPTPALALASMGAGAAAIMVTGSHIPADRNGLKFYLPDGEITKADETAILAALALAPVGDDAVASNGTLTSNHDAGTNWCTRYVSAFGTHALSGLRIGVWSHSAVSRDLLINTLSDLGAEIVETGRSDEFVPVDTEAIPEVVHTKISAWIEDHNLDALVSTDGDGDRPLMADEKGRVVAGDILGQITSGVIGAENVVTPVSSNSGVQLNGVFNKVLRTKIGSPFVIAAMQAAGGKVVGYEANGGFLLGFDVDLLSGKLPSLATRDSLLPLVAPLSKAKSSGGLSNLVNMEPKRFTAADRLENVDTERSNALIAIFKTEPNAVSDFLRELDETAAGTSDMDGLRITCNSGRIIHFRPSGNAPEFRLYIEAESQTSAARLLEAGLSELKKALR